MAEHLISSPVLPNQRREVKVNHALVLPIRDPTYESSFAGRNQKPLLMDGQMPQIDGFETSRRIKNNPMFTSAIIVMLTSVDLRGAITRCKQIGISAYLVKPVKQPELLHAIRMVMSLEGSDEQHKKADVVVLERIREERHRQSLGILLVEDNYINQRMAQKLLEKQRHLVTIAENGQKVVDALEEETFDLVLMDVQMPVMDGRKSKSLIRKP